MSQKQTATQESVQLHIRADGSALGTRVTLPDGTEVPARSVRFEHEVGKRPNISIEVVEINGELDGTVENVLIKKVPPPQAKPHLRMRIQGPEKRWFRQRCFWHLDRIIPVHDTGSIVDRLASGWIDDTGVGPVEFTAED